MLIYVKYWILGLRRSLETYVVSLCMLEFILETLHTYRIEDLENFGEVSQGFCPGYIWLVEWYPWTSQKVQCLWTINFPKFWISGKVTVHWQCTFRPVQGYHSTSQIYPGQNPCETSPKFFKSSRHITMNISQMWL